MVFSFVTSFSNLGLRSSRRLGARYRYFVDELDSVIFLNSTLKPTRVIDLIFSLKKTIIKKGTLDTARVLIELEDVKSKTSALLSEKTVIEVGSNKLDFADADILIAKIEPELGKILINRKEKLWIGSTEWIPLKLNSEKVTAPFFKYLLLNPKVLTSLGLLKSGKIQARLPIEELLQLKLPIPSIETQENITADLLEIDGRITTITKSIRPISQICDDTFFRVFGLTVPRGVVSRFQTSFSQIGSNRLMRVGFRQNMLTTKIKEMQDAIPEWVSLSSLATVRGGRRLKKGSGYSSGVTKYKYLRNTDIVDGEVNTRAIRYISEKQHASIERYQVFENEIVMAIAGTVGKVAIIPEGLGTSNLTENLAVLSPKDSVEPKYLFCLLNSSIVQIQIQKEMSELRQQKLGLAKVRNLKIPKPPEKKEDQLQIVDQAMAEINQMRKQKNEITDLLHLAVKEKVEPRLMEDIPTKI